MSEHTFEVTDANFQNEVLQSELPTLVDFTAEWCPPCHMIAPTVEALAKKYEGKLRVGKLDADLHQNTVETYGVQGLPTLILFKHGKAVQQMVGFRTQGQLEASISEHL
jgi:thioredoxin 1